MVKVLVISRPTLRSQVRPEKSKLWQSTGPHAGEGEMGRDFPPGQIGSAHFFFIFISFFASFAA